MSDNALGRGLDALIKKPSKSKKSKKAKDTQTIKKTVVENTPAFSLSDEKMEQIKKEVEKNPRISLWSAKSAAVLRYLKKTTPEFSISNEASEILEEAIKNKYPEIWQLFEE